MQVMGTKKQRTCQEMISGASAAFGCSCLILFAIGTVIFYGLFLHAREDARMVGCIDNQKQIKSALALYASDHDSRLPPSSQWMDLIQPYLKHPHLQCPSAPELEYGYAFFRPLSNRKLSTIPQPQITPMIFDSTKGQRNHADDGQSLAFRHEKCAVVTFVDGHAKLLSQSSSRRIFKSQTLE